MEKNEKWIQYAVIISAQIQEMFEEDATNKIDLEELAEGDNAKHFLHALANVVPCKVYNKLTRNEKTYLEFNHLANVLCFENMTKD